jgi:hypothetical protein
MTLKTRAHQLADDIVRFLPGDRLPTRWNGAWLTVPRASWESVHRLYEPCLARVLKECYEIVFLDAGSPGV